MDKQTLKELKKQANELKPMFNIGKNGLTENFYEGVDAYLAAHEIVKIKVLIAEDKSSVDYFADEVAKELDALLIEKKGFTFVLFRER